MYVHFVFSDVSICGPVLICIYPTHISTFYSDSKEFYLQPPKKAGNWAALTLGNCILLVVGMFLDQKTSFYDYSYLDYGFRVMFIGKGLYSFLES